jgi:hypothetical protein
VRSANEVLTSDYIIFASYMQPALAEGAGLWSNTDELETINGTHLSLLITTRIATNNSQSTFSQTSCQL